MKELLEVKNLSVSYQQKVVSDVSMTLHRQEIVGLIGQNGCGKSTLLKGIIGGRVSTQRQVYVSGQDYCAMNIKMRAQNIAMMTQRCEVIEGFTVSEMIELGGYASSRFFDSHIDEERIMQIAKEFQIADLLDEDYTKLSEGQKQLVQLARLTRQNTPVLLLDEPDSALDFENRHHIFQLIQKLIKEQEKTGFIVLHDPLYAFMYCDRILLMKDGRIIDEIIPLQETCEIMTYKMQNLYPQMIIQRDQDYQQFYCLTK